MSTTAQFVNHLMPAPFRDYAIGMAYDEMFRANGRPRTHYRNLYTQLLKLPPEELHRFKKEADLSFFNQGITFTVYGRAEGTEQIFPHDLLPRIVTSAEWETIERGLTQRITALNLFLADIYHERRILKDRVIPGEIIYTCKHFRRQMQGVKVPRGVYVSVAGTDLIRLPDGGFVVLEDNLRVPSGVSYMLTSRKVMKQIFPMLFRKCRVRPIEQYSQALLSTLRSLAPGGPSPPSCCSPRGFTTRRTSSTHISRGKWASSWWKAAIWWSTTMWSTCGPLPVCSASMSFTAAWTTILSIPWLSAPILRWAWPGLFNAYRAGNVVLANALGTGVADDKAIYSYVPKMIRYYLDEDPIVDNVETFLMTDRAQREESAGTWRSMS